MRCASHREPPVRVRVVRALLLACCSATALGCHFLGASAGDDGDDAVATAEASDSASSDEEGSSTTADPGPPAGPLTVATFNVKLFFDPVCDSGACGPGDFEQVPSAEAFGARSQQIASAIRTLDADLVLLQEVETQRCVDALMAELADDGYVSAVLGETGTPGSIDVATLSRVPIDNVLRHGKQALLLPSGGTTFFTREFLEVRLRFGGRDVSVFNGHFKSKVDDDPERRLAEAIAAERIVSARAEAIPDGAVFFGGDLNDTPGSAPLDAIEDPGDLRRVAAELLDDATYEFQGQRVAIDHLFIATPASGGSYVQGSAEVFRSPTWGFGGSDHAALAATFTVGLN